MIKIKILLTRFVFLILSKLSSVIGQILTRKNQSYKFSRSVLLKNNDINLIVDIGANSGQYASSIREHGYSGLIISIEPLPDAFSELSSLFSGDDNWTGYNCACGDTSEQRQINISEDSVCSSLVTPTKTFLKSIPTAKTVTTVDVDVHPLDDLLKDICIEDHNILLKIDVQGFERNVLKGATNILNKAQLVEIELSVLEGYSETFNIKEGVDFFFESGFYLYSLGRGHSDENSGQLIDADFIFKKI